MKDNILILIAMTIFLAPFVGMPIDAYQSIRRTFYPTPEEVVEHEKVLKELRESRVPWDDLVRRWNGYYDNHYEN